MTVRSIIIAHLRKVGADGLCCEGCGCGIDHLVACGNETAMMECVPAKLGIAKKDGDCWSKGDEICVPMETNKQG